MYAFVQVQRKPQEAVRHLRQVIGPGAFHKGECDRGGQKQMAVEREVLASTDNPSALKGHGEATQSRPLSSSSGSFTAGGASTWKLSRPTF